MKVVNLSQKDAPSAASVDVKSVQLANDQVLNIDKTEETNVLPTFGGVVVIPDSTSTDGIKAETETIWRPKKAQIKSLIDAENIIGEKYPMLLGTAANVAGITQFYRQFFLSDYLSVSCSLFRQVVSYTSVYIVI